MRFLEMCVRACVSACVRPLRKKYTVNHAFFSADFSAVLPAAFSADFSAGNNAYKYTVNFEDFYALISTRILLFRNFCMISYRILRITFKHFTFMIFKPAVFREGFFAGFFYMHKIINDIFALLVCRFSCTTLSF